MQQWDCQCSPTIILTFLIQFPKEKLPVNNVVTRMETIHVPQYYILTISVHTKQGSAATTASEAARKA